MPYSLVVTRIACKVGSTLTEPPKDVDLTGESPSNFFFLPQWERAEDVPVPPPGRPKIYRDELFCLYFQVAKVPQTRTLFDVLPSGTQVDLRVGGPGYYFTATCPVEKGPDTIRELLTKLVADGQDESYGWGYVEVRIIRAYLPSGTTIDWDSSGYSASLNPAELEILSEMVEAPHTTSAFETFALVAADLKSIQDRITSP